MSLDLDIIFDSVKLIEDWWFKKMYENSDYIYVVLKTDWDNCGGFNILNASNIIINESSLEIFKYDIYTKQIICIDEVKNPNEYFETILHKEVVKFLNENKVKYYDFTVFYNACKAMFKSKKYVNNNLINFINKSLIFKFGNCKDCNVYLDFEKIYSFVINTKKYWMNKKDFYLLFTDSLKILNRNYLHVKNFNNCENVLLYTILEDKSSHTFFDIDKNPIICKNLKKNLKYSKFRFFKDIDDKSNIKCYENYAYFYF